jgi:hypothetical protein
MIADNTAYITSDLVLGVLLNNKTKLVTNQGTKGLGPLIGETSTYGDLIYYGEKIQSTDDLMEIITTGNLRE